MSTQLALLLQFAFIIVFLFAVNAASAASTNAKWKCDGQSKKEVDETVARIMTFGRSDRSFPVDKNALRPYCKEQSQMVNRLEDYKTQCLKGRSKQTVSIIVYSMKNLINLYCKNPNSKRANDLLHSAPCANEATAEYNKCNIDYIDLLLAVEFSKDSKQQLTQLCCGYAEVFKCIRERASSIERCNEEQIEANVNYVRGFFDNAANLICGDYTTDSDKCDKVKLFRKKNKQPSKRPQSYFNPLVNLLSSL